MRYSEDFVWVEDICRKVYLSVKYHPIWGLKSVVVGCSVVRAHCCEAQLEIEILCKAFGYHCTVTLIMPLIFLYCYLSIMMSQYG